MCGIIGISSNKPVSANIINSLKKLEYRGNDSAGIATLSKGQIKFLILMMVNFVLLKKIKFFFSMKMDRRLIKKY